MMIRMQMFNPLYICILYIRSKVCDCFYLRSIRFFSQLLSSPAMRTFQIIAYYRQMAAVELACVSGVNKIKKYMIAILLLLLLGGRVWLGWVISCDGKIWVIMNYISHYDQLWIKIVRIDAIVSNGFNGWCGIYLRTASGCRQRYFWFVAVVVAAHAAAASVASATSMHPCCHPCCCIRCHGLLLLLCWCCHWNQHTITMDENWLTYV